MIIRYLYLIFYSTVHLCHICCRIKITWYKIISIHNLSNRSLRGEWYKIDIKLRSRIILFETVMKSMKNVISNMYAIQLQFKIQLDSKIANLLICNAVIRNERKGRELGIYCMIFFCKWNIIVRDN